MLTALCQAQVLPPRVLFRQVPGGLTVSSQVNGWKLDDHDLYWNGHFQAVMSGRSMPNR